MFNKEDDNDDDGDADYGEDIIKEENGENSNDLQATLAAYAIFNINDQYQYY